MILLQKNLFGYQTKQYYLLRSMRQFFSVNCLGTVFKGDSDLKKGSRQIIRVKKDSLRKKSLCRSMIRELGIQSKHLKREKIHTKK